MKQYKIILASMLLCCSVSVNAQMLYKSVLASGGKSYSSAGLNADWTVGQPVVNQYTASGLVVTEGFHPVFIASAPVSVKQIISNIQSLKAYPNPTNSTVNIIVEQSLSKPLSIDVLDVTGKKVMNTVNIEPQRYISTSVDLSAFGNGTYIIMMNANTDDAYTMKVVKE